jgi:uncharacterized protein (DUF58 family)
MLTPRWYLLALVLPALLLLAGTMPVMLVPALIYGAGLLFLTWLDRRSAGNPDQFRATRQHDQKLSLGVPNPVTVELQAHVLHPLEITLRDEAPLEFVVTDSASAAAALQPADRAFAFTYHVLPRQRGNFQFGRINLRWDGPLGLFIRQATFGTPAQVKVYPNIYEIRRYELLVRRNQLNEMGLHTLRGREQGTAFESLREYTPDDPYRAINWKATARRGKPTSTDYEPERDQRVIIGLDVGRMMQSSVRIGPALSMAKVDFAINSILLFSYVATRKGDRVGLLVFADRVKQFIPPGTRFQALLEAMYALSTEPVEADYERAVSYLRARQQKRALVVFFTDLSGSRAAETLLAHLPRLMPRHLPLLVTLRDSMLDREAGQAIAGSENVYRRMVAEQLLDERRLLLDNLERRGVLTLDMDAEHLSTGVINRYLELKSRLSA